MDDKNKKTNMKLNMDNGTMLGVATIAMARATRFVRNELGGGSGTWDTLKMTAIAFTVFCVGYFLLFGFGQIIVDQDKKEKREPKRWFRIARQIFILLVMGSLFYYFAGEFK